MTDINILRYTINGIYEGLRYAHLLIHGIQRFYCPSLGDETTSTSDK